jgi:hypothetical protein
MSSEEIRVEEPLVRLQPGGKASIIDYNVPDSVSYGGQHYIGLDVDPDWFTPAANGGRTYADWLRDRYGIDLADETPATRRGRVDVVERIREGLADDGGPVVLPAHDVTLREMDRSDGSAPVTGLRPTVVRPMFRTIGTAQPSEPLADASGDLASEADTAATDTSAAELRLQPLAMARSIAPEVAEAIQPEAVANAVLDAKIPLLRYNLAGTLVPTTIRAPPQTNPQLMLVERYRLSTYLGDYGAGRTLKTFSLLPGEETTISLRSYRKSKTEREHASSILDSFTETAAREFERHVESEQWDREAYSGSFGWKSSSSVSGGGGAGLNLGFFKIGGSAKASSRKTVEVGAEVAREEFSKNVTSAVSKHAHESSSRRDVEINTNYEASVETGESKSTVRRIENVNLGRTLNFVFRQMNQEFHTVVHLVDVRVAFTNGTVQTNAAGTSISGLSYREVPLSQLDDLLDEFVDADHHDDVRSLIEAELSSVTNYAGEQHSMVERGEIRDVKGTVVREFLRVPRITDEYEDRKIPGVVVSAVTNVLRTEGVVVEALLGQSDALDRYSARLQEEAVEGRDVANDSIAAETEKTRLGVQVVRDADAERAAVYRDVFGPTPSPTDPGSAPDERAPTP